VGRQRHVRRQAARGRTGANLQQAVERDRREATSRL